MPEKNTTKVLGKSCIRCGRFRFKEFFSSSKKNKDGMISWCKPCVKTYDAERYQLPKERSRLLLKQREIRKRNTDYIKNYLKNNPCVDCGESDIIVLEFDHIRGDKKFCISRAKTEGYSIKTIQTEIDKCQVRCANCHRRITHKRRIA